MITRSELKKVKEKIVEEPHNFQMGSFSCGTAYCIGGWLEVLFPNKYKISSYNDKLSKRNMPDINCSIDRRSFLFYHLYWRHFLTKDNLKRFEEIDYLNFDSLDKKTQQFLALTAIDDYIKYYNVN